MQPLFSPHLAYVKHLASVQKSVQEALEQSRLQGLWIFAGSAARRFLDDQTVPFKINPHFNYVFPHPAAENSWLYLDGHSKPKIYFYAPQDYWHAMPSPPTEAFFASEFEWQILTDENAIRQFICPTHCAFIGEQEQLAQSLGFSEINPQKVLNVLHFARACKSEFEIDCLREAQKTALIGHHAAKKAFFEGKSEFEINLCYLQATAQSDCHVPYGNIVAINQNSAILHYTTLETQPPSQRHSFLLDAGTSCLGYASDITRSYAFDPNSEFAVLVARLEQCKLNSIAELAVGVNYLNYHSQMHRWIAELLAEFDFVRLPAEQIFEEGISRTFFPHGLGHLLGLQVHDVAGFQQNSRGTRKSPPDIYPSLRCTRDLQAGMVLTIEPGFYFIEMLLKVWRNHPLGRYFNWQKMDEFKKFGGIRTEDNVLIREKGAENLTAQAEHEILMKG